MLHLLVMACYKITIKLTNKPTIVGIKEHSSSMIEVVFNYFRNKSFAHYGESNIKEFDCVLISKQSADYKAWMEMKKKKAGISKDTFSLGKDEQ